MGGTAKIVLFLLFCFQPFYLPFDCYFLSFFTVQKRPEYEVHFWGAFARELKLGKPLSRLAEQGLEHLEKLPGKRWILLIGFWGRKYPEIQCRKYPEIHDGLNAFLPKSLLSNRENAEHFQILSEHKSSVLVYSFRTSEGRLRYSFSAAQYTDQELGILAAKLLVERMLRSRSGISFSFMRVPPFGGRC